jgi:uncharacterized protein (TIGR03067 family)
MNQFLKMCLVLMALATSSADNSETPSLKGKWVACASINEEGKPVLLKGDDAHFCRMTFGDKQLTVQSTRVTFEATYSLGSQHAQKTIDVIRIIKRKPVTFRGIYEQVGDRLRLCLAGPDDNRPTAFRQADDIELALELRRER